MPAKQGLCSIKDEFYSGLALLTRLGKAESITPHITNMSEDVGLHVLRAGVSTILFCPVEERHSMVPVTASVKNRLS